ncbi:hypothetical protein [Novosphingobium huizhouense]|uniref:hypothetical protein n=1 Tax=Novosphingobium huizhouense TaxID=2866625 RepID=UPI001CD8BE81|nr:hypothetical protein [Novosphingobium huizhouense]
MFDRILWWIGLIHVAAYASAAFTVVSALFFEWIIRRWKLKREMLLAYQEVLCRRRGNQDRASG